MKTVLLDFIRLYQKTLSPFWPTTCRYSPSCSHYSYEAIQKHGPFKGGGMTLRRLWRCQPWGDFGYDPVPEKSRANVVTTE